MLRQVKAYALYSTSTGTLIFCVVLWQFTADYLVSLLIVSSVEEMKEKLMGIPTVQTTTCCINPLVAIEVHVLGCEMQSSVSLTSFPDGVAISSRETQQLTRGNKASSFLHCYEKE